MDLLHLFRLVKKSTRSKCKNLVVGTLMWSSVTLYNIMASVLLWICLLNAPALFIIKDIASHIKRYLGILNVTAFKTILG